MENEINHYDFMDNNAKKNQWIMKGEEGKFSWLVESFLM
jgi:hypothetical protein